VELLSWKSTKDLRGDGGVVKTVLAEGSGWEKAREGDGAVISYSAADAAGAALASADHLALPSLADAPCAGLALALASMKAGERASVLLTPVEGKEYLGRLASPAGGPVTVQLTLHSIQKVDDVEGTDGAVRKKILVAGEGYERPNELASVRLRLRLQLAGEAGALLLPDTELACNADDEALLRGLDKAVLTMHKGETAEVSLPAAWCAPPRARARRARAHPRLRARRAFGAEGYAPPAQPRAAPAEGEAAAALREAPLAAVPPSAALSATLTLLDFTKDKESWDLTAAADKLAYAEAKKTEGNALFAAAPGRASKRYTKALKMVEHDSSWSDGEQRASKALKALLHSNVAAAMLRCSPADHAAAAKAAAASLALDGSNGKARFRAALAAAGLRDYVEAEGLLKRLLEDEPGHAEAQRELARVKLAARAQNAKDAKLYGRMFGPPPTKKAEEPAAAAAAEAAAEAA